MKRNFILISLIIMIALVFIGCPDEKVKQAKVANPTSETSVSTSIKNTDKIVLICSTKDAKIMYKIDGDSKFSDYPIGGFTIPTEKLAESVTVIAKATKEGMTDSDEVRFTYKIEKEKVASPTSTTSTSNFIKTTDKIVLTCSTEDAKILYKIDGDANFIDYTTGGFTIPTEKLSENVTVIAKATKEGMKDSDEVNFTYKFGKVKLIVPNNEKEFEYGNIISTGGKTVKGKVLQSDGTYKDITFTGSLGNAKPSSNFIYDNSANKYKLVVKDLYAEGENGLLPSDKVSRTYYINPVIHTKVINSYDSKKSMTIGGNTITAYFVFDKVTFSLPENLKDEDIRIRINDGAYPKPCIMPFKYSLTEDKLIEISLSFGKFTFELENTTFSYMKDDIKLYYIVPVVGTGDIEKEYTEEKIDTLHENGQDLFIKLKSGNNISGLKFKYNSDFNLTITEYTNKIDIGTLIEDYFDQGETSTVFNISAYKGDDKLVEKKYDIYCNESYWENHI